MEKRPPETAREAPDAKRDDAETLPAPPPEMTGYLGPGFDPTLHAPAAHAPPPRAPAPRAPAPQAPAAHAPAPQASPARPPSPPAAGRAPGPGFPEISKAVFLPPSVAAEARRADPRARRIRRAREAAARLFRALASGASGWLAKRRAARAGRRRVPFRRAAWLWAKRLVLAALAAIALGLFAFAYAVHHYGKDLPKTHELHDYDPPQVTRVLARDGALLSEVFTERRTLVPITELPKHVKLAFLAAEDARFYEHEGLNFFGMLRALVVNLRSGSSRQGGSTITQQVIKNVLLSSERTYERKMKELVLARRIEQELSKDQILELYLNHIYFGHGRYGVEEAARHYFGKSARALTLAEAALLAGIVKGPSRYSPRASLELALGRRRYVLEQMRQKRFAKPAEVDAAQREPVRLSAEPEAKDELAPEAVRKAMDELRDVLGERAERGGFTIETTIDPKMQAAARAAVRQNLDAYAARRGLVAPFRRGRSEPAPFSGSPRENGIYLGLVTGADDAAGTLSLRVGSMTGKVDLRKQARYNPAGLLPSAFADVGKVLRVRVRGAPSAGKLDLALAPEGALVALDLRTREILAMVGGYEAAAGALDRSRRALRQPGSTFKIFVYAEAIRSRKMTAASLLETDPAALSGKYRPSNYDGSSGTGRVRMREALAKSVNVSAVWAIDEVGPASVARLAKDLGIHAKLGADSSLALGAYEVTPLEMASAYAALSDGAAREPTVIRRVLGPGGKVVALPREAPRKVLEPAEAFLATSLLRSVVEGGTAKAARSLGRPVVGKTGTSNEAKDAWFVGYSTEIACASWTGFDDASPLGKGESGGATALPAFIAFMARAHEGHPASDFQVPAGVSRAMVDPYTGGPALPFQPGAFEEYFLEGTGPAGLASPDPLGGEDPAEPPRFRIPWPF